MNSFDVYSMARDFGFLVAIGLLLARVRQLSQEPVSLRELVIDQGRQIDELRKQGNETVDVNVNVLRAQSQLSEIQGLAQNNIVALQKNNEALSRRIVDVMALASMRTEETDKRLTSVEDTCKQSIKRVAWLEEAAAAKTPTAPEPKAAAEKSLDKVRKALKKKARK